MANNITLSYPSAFHHQFLDLNGKPLTGGKLYTYIAGSTTPVVTYKTISGGTESANRNTNPIILDMAGMAELVIATDTAYKFVLFDKNDAKIAEWDNVTGNIGGGGGGSEDIVVVGTPNEIDVSGSVTQGVKRYVVSLSNSVKSTILYLVGLYNNVLNSLGNKADKVQGATAGNIAALDANGNLTDSGSKSADFKTKQTPVADPSASGAGLEFIDSVSQNPNGEITPHKKAVQDGTTAQKGVVKLSNSIDSTSVTEAATPKAVKDAYDELNNKIVARAVFLSQAEWAVQSQLPGDPAKVYYVENGTGEDAYTVYVWKESTSTYEEVDESSIDLDGYWHDSPTTTGSGNVVTNITLGNDGVPQIEKGLTALTQHQDISGKADKVSNATNGDLAALDANGNLTDSGKKAADFAVSSVYNETDPRNLRSFIKCAGNGTQFYRKLATTNNINHTGNSSVIKLEGCVGAWGSGDTTDFSIVVRTRGIVLFEASVFKRIGSANAFDKVNFELYEESDGTYSLWLNSSAAYTICIISISAFTYGGAYIVYDGTDGTPTGTLVASASQNYKVMMVTDGDGSNVSVTPDGTSTGYDLGSSTTLKAFAQKFKNLVSALKALAFKDKASYDDLSSGVQSSLDKADSALQSHQSVTDNNPTLDWGTTSKVGSVGGTDLRVTMPANPASYKVPFFNIDISLASLDLNTLTTQGFYYCPGFPSSSVVLSNIPSELNNYTKSWRLEVISQRSRIEQILVNASDNGKDSTRVMCIWKRHRFSDGTSWTPWCMIPLSSAGGVGSTTTPVYVDSYGQMQPCDVLSGGTTNFNRTFTTSYTVGSTDQYITTLIKNDNTDLIADYVTWHNANVGKLSSPPMIIISVFTRDTDVANAGLISLNMYKTGNGCDVFGEKYAYMGNQHGSQAYNTQYFTDQTFVSGSAYYLNIRNETPNTMWAAGTILDISIRIVAHAVSVT